MTNYKNMKKVWDGVIDAKYDISACELADKLDLTQETASKWLQELEQEDRIQQTRKIGNAILYDSNKV